MIQMGFYVYSSEKIKPENIMSYNIKKKIYSFETTYYAKLHIVDLKISNNH